MKLSSKILSIIVVLLTGVILYFSTYPLFQIISNYESLSPVTISGFPLFMVVATLITICIFGYRFFYKDNKNLFAVRHYSILCLVFSTIGVGTSILCGTWVYHTFFGPYVFACYPFIMLIVNSIFLLGSIYYMVRSQSCIRSNGLKNEQKSSVFHVFATLGWTLLLIFALSRLGSFLVLPIYWSEDNSIYVLPFLIQQIIPMALIVCGLFNKDVIKNKKFGLISSIVLLGYSLLSLIYMIALEKVCEAETHLANATIYINPLSTILNLERLLTWPLYFILIYAISLAIPLINLIVIIAKAIKNKSKQKVD